MWDLIIRVIAITAMGAIILAYKLFILFHLGIGPLEYFYRQNSWWLRANYHKLQGFLRSSIQEYWEGTTEHGKATSSIWGHWEEAVSAGTPPEHLLTFSLGLFFLSLVGICFNKQGNTLIVMLFFELMLFSLGFMSISFSLIWGYPQGQIFALLIMAVAVAESTIGLGLLIIVFRTAQRIDLNEFSYIRA